MPDTVDYSEDVNLSRVLKGFYFDQLKLEDMKEYILPAFRKLNGP